MHKLVLGLKKLIFRSAFDDPSLPEDRDEIGDPASGSEVMADHQVAAAALCVNLSDQFAKKGGADGIQTRIRFVEHHDFWIEDERPGEPGPLPHAA